MISVLDLFRIGVGPSSSHTVGPIRIAGRFAASLHREKVFEQTSRVEVKLRGSLAFTGIGHGTPDAVLMGLMGLYPQTLDIEKAHKDIAVIKATKTLLLDGKKKIAFDTETDLLFDYDSKADIHPNEMWMGAFCSDGKLLREQTYYSTGGGFIASKAQLLKPVKNDIVRTGGKVPFPFEIGRGPSAVL